MRDGNALYSKSDSEYERKVLDFNESIARVNEDDLHYYSRFPTVPRVSRGFQSSCHIAALTGSGSGHFPYTQSTKIGRGGQ